MPFDLSRRALFTGAAGATVTGLAAAGLTGCSQPAAQALPDQAFPPGRIDPYLLGPGEGVALLSRNENPYGPAQSALDMIEYAATKGAYYANQEAYMTLAALIAERNGVDPEQVVLTTGSGEVLSAIALLYGPRGPILAPRLFWDTTALYAANLGLAEIERVPLTADMGIDLPAIEARVTADTGLVQLCNPNNPTGLVAEPAEFQAAVRRMAATTTVLVDEAYIELSDDPEANSCVPLIREGHDVIVTRTFSKIYGMAGIRVGYAIASAETAAAIRPVVMSWSPCTSYAAGIGCYDDTDFIDYSRSKIVEGRDMVFATLDTLGLDYLPSQTNFVYFRSGIGANPLQAAMAERQISIRGQYMDYADWSRVSMGRIEDVERFCTSLPQILGA